MDERAYPHRKPSEADQRRKRLSADILLVSHAPVDVLRSFSVTATAIATATSIAVAPDAIVGIVLIATHLIRKIM